MEISYVGSLFVSEDVVGRVIMRACVEGSRDAETASSASV